MRHHYEFTNDKFEVPEALNNFCSTLAWKIPCIQKPGRLQSMGSLSQTQLSDFTFTFPFHALEKEMASHSSVLAWGITDRGAWWPALYGVTHSWTRLKCLSSSRKIMVRTV